MQYIFDLSGGM